MLYLFDMDGTLRRARLLLPAPVATWDQRILPGRLERLRALRNEGHRLGAASNQGGVAMGIMTVQRCEEVMQETNRRLDGLLEWIRFCPHHPRGLRRRYRQRCACRKPAPGMLLEALTVFGCAPADATYIGDSSKDADAARAAGFHYVGATDFFSQ